MSQDNFVCQSGIWFHREPDDEMVPPQAGGHRDQRQSLSLASGLSNYSRKAVQHFLWVRLTHSSTCARQRPLSVRAFDQELSQALLHRAFGHRRLLDGWVFPTIPTGSFRRDSAEVLFPMWCCPDIDSKRNILISEICAECRPRLPLFSFSALRTLGRPCGSQGRLASMLRRLNGGGCSRRLHRLRDLALGLLEAMASEYATYLESQSQDVHHCSDSDADVLRCRPF